MEVSNKLKNKGKYQQLTTRQKKFVEEFFKDSSSVRQAAIRAGYSRLSAHDAGNHNLKNPRVVEALDELHNIRKHRLGLTEDRILKELCSIAFANMGDFLVEDENGELKINWKSLTPEQTAALSEVSKGKMGSKIKLTDKLAALVHIGKHLGMFREKIEVQGKLSLEQLVLDSMKIKDEDGTS